VEQVAVNMIYCFQLSSW